MYVFASFHLNVCLLFSLSILPSYDQVFKTLPQQIPDRDHTEPYCGDIIDLPFSMMAMDHLPGVQMRSDYESLERSSYAEEEPELVKVRNLYSTTCLVSTWVSTHSWLVHTPG